MRNRANKPQIFAATSIKIKAPQSYPQNRSSVDKQTNQIDWQKTREQFNLDPFKSILSEAVDKCKGKSGDKRLEIRE